MTINQKQIAMTEFNLAVFKKNGQEFEDFFVDIMKRHDPHFLPVKAHGNIGDRKNDGYNRTTGEYFQVFAPSDIEKTQTISDATTKLDEDFKGLIANWDKACPVKVYNFVINDKFKGVSPIIHGEVNKMNSSYPDIEIKLFLSQDLQEIFRNLRDEHIYDFCRYMPNEEIILEYSALGRIIKYINEKYKFPKVYDSALFAPNFDEKIQFNGLSPLVSNYLHTANFQVGCLETYFRADNKYLKKEFESLFKGLYSDSKLSICDNDENFADTRFFYILEALAPDQNKETVSAILVLMSYYFESCDIFERPTKGEEQ